MRTRFLVILLFGMIFAACNTSRSVVSRDADLSKYEYASVINNETYRIPARLMEYEMQLFDAIARSGLELVSDMRIDDLSPEQKSKLLIVKYGLDITEHNKFVLVSFLDYETGRPVATCRGECPFKLYTNDELNGAIEKVGEQVAKTFNRQS